MNAGGGNMREARHNSRSWCRVRYSENEDEDEDEDEVGVIEVTTMRNWYEELIGSKRRGRCDSPLSLSLSLLCVRVCISVSGVCYCG